MVFGLSNIEAIWIAVGLLGQLMFSGRFIVQWIASERQNKMVIPVMFWHFSLWGGLILLAYAIYRKDAVFIIGQLTGVFIYARNLYFVYRDENKNKSKILKSGKIKVD